MANDGELALPKEVVILLCILSAAALTTIGYAIHRVFNPDFFRAQPVNHFSASQQEYLRDVRQRNLRDLQGQMPPQNQQQYHRMQKQASTYAYSDY